MMFSVIVQGLAHAAMLCALTRRLAIVSSDIGLGNRMWFTLESLVRMCHTRSRTRRWVRSPRAW